VIFEEIESLIPALSGDAQALRSQADQLQDYCVSLEERQDEMKRIVQKAFGANAQGEINMSPH
jgi:chaperonin cofactor prefoldin